jgi:hypothetical protein
MFGGMVAERPMGRKEHGASDEGTGSRIGQGPGKITA